MHTLWQRIEIWLRNEAPHAWSLLLPAASEWEIEQAEAAMDIMFPEDFKASCRIHNGRHSIDLVTQMNVLPLKDMVAEWQMFKELDDMGTWADVDIPYYFTEKVRRSGWQTAEAMIDDASASLTQALQWVNIGVMTYEYLLDHPGDYSSRISLEHSLMWLRAFFIIRLGPLEHDALLDIEQIVAWVFRDLPYSLQELRSLIKLWHRIRKQPHMLKQLSNDKEIIIE